MAFHFEFSESIAAGVRRIAEERLDRVVQELGERPNAEDIHDARKSLKSLRALLAMIRGTMEDDKRRQENTLFRDAGRTLGKSRDASALTEALDKLAVLRGPGANQRRELLNNEALKPLRKKLRQEAKRPLDGEALRGIRQTVEESRQRSSQWVETGETEIKWSDAVGVGLKRTYRQARSLLADIHAGTFTAVEDGTWHELRKQAKALGYQLRLLLPVWPATLKPLIDEIDALTELLGDDHDLVLVRVRFLAETPVDRTNLQIRRRIVGLLRRRQRHLRLQALAVADRIFAEKPAQFGRRLQRYWLVWKTKLDLAGRPKDRPEKPVTGSVPGQLAKAELRNAGSLESSRPNHAGG